MPLPNPSFRIFKFGPFMARVDWDGLPPVLSLLDTDLVTWQPLNVVVGPPSALTIETPGGWDFVWMDGELIEME
jgi:hypothetical protein